METVIFVYLMHKAYVIVVDFPNPQQNLIMARCSALTSIFSPIKQIRQAVFF